MCRQEGKKEWSTPELQEFPVSQEPLGQMCVCAEMETYGQNAGNSSVSKIR